MRMLYSVVFHENMELRQRFNDQVDYKMLNNCSSLDLEAHVKGRRKYKKGSEVYMVERLISRAKQK